MVSNQAVINCVSVLPEQPLNEPTGSIRSKFIINVLSICHLRLLEEMMMLIFNWGHTIIGVPIIGMTISEVTSILYDGQNGWSRVEMTDFWSNSGIKYM